MNSFPPSFSLNTAKPISLSLDFTPYLSSLSSLSILSTVVLLLFEVDPPPSVSGSVKEEGKGEGGRLVISLRWLSEHATITKSRHATTPPCLCVCFFMTVCVQYGCVACICLRVCEFTSVLIVLGRIRLISDSPQSPTMTCLPHITHCTQNTDERCG